LTHIFWIQETQQKNPFQMEDPRSHRELIQAINTGAVRVTLAGLMPANRPHETKETAITAADSRVIQRYWARSLRPLDVIELLPGPAPVRLSARQYEIMFAMADGLSADRIAARFAIRRRTVYQYIREIKERFQAGTRSQALATAIGLGLVPVDSDLYWVFEKLPE
jgi:DNA-binding CsgD family transcriptional regulator